MHNCGTMAKSVTAICHFCLFKVDAKHKYKWWDHNIITNCHIPVAVQTCPYRCKCAVLPSVFSVWMHVSWSPANGTLNLEWTMRWQGRWLLLGVLTVACKLHPMWCSSENNSLHRPSTHHLRWVYTCTYACGLLLLVVLVSVHMHVIMLVDCC